MKRMNRPVFTAGVVVGALVAWAGISWLGGPALANSGTGWNWLRGTPQEALGQVETQLRGMDMTMKEIGYRFTELYFAGKDENWDYAAYHLEKIGDSLALGLERRPARAASAQDFMNKDLPAAAALVEQRDPAAFHQAMLRLRTSCNKCHVAEEVPFFTVNFPEHRASSIAPLDDLEDDPIRDADAAP